MSSLTKRISKKISKSSLIFPDTMYTNAFGSIAICDYIFTEDKEKYPLEDVKKIWNKVSKHPEKYIDWTFDDPEFIGKTLKLFGLKKPDVWSIACCMSSFNVLFVPFDRENKVALPLRDDGITPSTMRHGKIYPVED